ncbi:MAG: proton-conducting transporter membrane subunit [Elusimicrobiota bacterium]|nr:proton-conducting transporter membrane subunit [Elusimicrobiota bacterium]
MTLIPSIVIIPLAAAFIVSLLDFIKEDFIRNLSMDIIAGLAIALSLIVSLALFGNPGTYAMAGWEFPVGIILVVDGFSAPILVITNFIALMCIVFSYDYIKEYGAKEKYYTLFLLMLTGMNGVIVTGDIFNLYVFLEIASVASYALVGFGTQREEVEATFKYLVLSSIGTAFMLLGIGLVYANTLNLNMAVISQIMAAGEISASVYLAAIFFIVGFSIKAALVPFHAWLPDAHPSAPAPISAMLSGVLIKTIGIYSFIRVTYVMLGMNTGAVPQALRVLGMLSMIIGVLLALGQWDFKRLLAYHSVSQMGYIALGFGLATPLGIIGALFHLLNHSVFKSLLFLNSGSVDYRLNTRNLRDMGGLTQNMPVTGTTSMIASLSIAGIPPFNGFWSKLIIIIAAIQAGHPILALWAVIASILTLASFVKVQRYAFIGKIKEALKEVRESTLAMQVPMIILAAACVLMGLLLVPSVRALVLEPAVEIILVPFKYIELVKGAMG